MFKSYGLCGCDDSDFSIDMNALRAKTKDKQNDKSGLQAGERDDIFVFKKQNR